MRTNFTKGGKTPPEKAETCSSAHANRQKNIQPTKSKQRVSAGKFHARSLARASQRARSRSIPISPTQPAVPFYAARPVSTFFLSIPSFYNPSRSSKIFAQRPSGLKIYQLSAISYTYVLGEKKKYIQRVTGAARTPVHPHPNTKINGVFPGIFALRDNLPFEEFST